MIVNLLSNASKFTPDGGKIGVEANVRADGGICIAVKDTGIGMAPEDIPKALAAFSQLDEGNGRRHDGTGLGLPIVKALIELHRGSLTLESARGVGTTATLHFPAAHLVSIAAQQKSAYNYRCSEIEHYECRHSAISGRIAVHAPTGRFGATLQFRHDWHY